MFVERRVYENTVILVDLYANVIFYINAEYLLHNLLLPLYYYQIIRKYHSEHMISKTKIIYIEIF